MFVPIPEFPEYLVSPSGEVFSSKSGNLLKHHTNSSGYLYVSLWINSKNKNLLVHRIVARVFKNLPSLDSELEVDHRDRNKLNINPDNLEVMTKEQHHLKTLKDLGYKSQEKKVCKICSIIITNKSTYCNKHPPSHVVKNKDITAEQIEFWVRNYSWVRAAKELGYSDNGLRKRYKALTGKDPKLIKK